MLNTITINSLGWDIHTGKKKQQLKQYSTHLRQFSPYTIPLYYKTTNTRQPHQNKYKFEYLRQSIIINQVWRHPNALAGGAFSILVAPELVTAVVAIIAN